MKIANIYPIPAEISNNKPIYPTGMIQGGGETEALTFAESLAESGHQVTYYTGKYSGINTNEIKISNNLHIKYLDVFYKKDSTLTYSFKLFFELVFGDFKVIQTHQIPILFALIGGIAAKLSNKIFIITFCGKIPITRVQKIIAKLVIYLADGIVVQNQYTKSIVSKFTPQKKLFIIPYSINNIFFQKKYDNKLAKIYKPHKEFILLSICRLIPAKGVDIIIESMELIIKKFDIPNIKLLIVGTGPMREKLESMVKIKKLENNIIFTGYVDAMELPYYYSLANIFILASTEKNKNGSRINEMCETFGLVLAEAMSCGTPVIASKIGGIPDWVINNYNGLLFNERDSKTLAKLIIKLYTDRKLAKLITNNALNEIQNKYSPKVIVKNFEKLYKKFST